MYLSYYNTEVRDAPQLLPPLNTSYIRFFLKDLYELDCLGQLHKLNTDQIRNLILHDSWRKEVSGIDFGHLLLIFLESACMTLAILYNLYTNLTEKPSLFSHFQCYSSCLYLIFFLLSPISFAKAFFPLRK